MVLSRRHALQAAGTAALAAIAGCSTDSPFGSERSTREYTLDIDRINADLVEYVRYEPDESSLFGDPARAALDEILPDGRHTTYGFTPLPNDAYVEHSESYYQTKHVVTGREQMERQLVRVTPIPKEEVPENTTLIDDLERPSARVLKILHSHTQTGGKTSTSDLLRDDAYVLRRPAERESQLAAGNLDDQVVTMTESGTWAYRVQVTREQITETAYTTLAIEVAKSRAQFREVIFGARVDVELAPSDLAEGTRTILEDAIARNEYTETSPLSESFEALLAALELGDVETGVTGKLLWYDGDLHRYGLYINTTD